VQNFPFPSPFRFSSHKSFSFPALQQKTLALCPRPSAFCPALLGYLLRACHGTVVCRARSRTSECIDALYGEKERTHFLAAMIVICLLVWLAYVCVCVCGVSSLRE